MHFDLSDEQKMLQANLSALLPGVIDANALARATAEEMAAARARIDAETAQMGLNAVLAPPEDGGLGLGLLTLAAAAEVLGANAAPSSALRGAVAAWAVAEGGSEAQKAAWLPGLLDGGLKAAFAFRDDPVEGAADADLFIVERDGLAVLDKAAAAIEPRLPLDASRAGAAVRFEGDGQPLGDAALAGRLRDAWIILLAADAYGAGQRALDMTVAYAQERRQFDRPIGSFQALKHQLADAALVMAPARFLAWRAAHAWDAAPAEAPRPAALAKAHVPEVAVATARAMVEAHGAVGYTWEYPLHLFLKRAMFDRVAWGAPAEHRARAAALAGW